MNLKIVVGDVELHVDGLELSKADITRMLHKVARVADSAAGGTDLTDLIEAAEEAAASDGTGSALDAHLTLSADDAPLFGFSRWMPEDPEWVPEEAP